MVQYYSDEAGNLYDDAGNLVRSADPPDPGTGGSLPPLSAYGPATPQFSEEMVRKLLDTDVPRDETTRPFWLISGKAARHLQLINIPSPEAHQRIRRKLIDANRITTPGWDPGYSSRRQAMIFADLLCLKSIGYGRDSMRERPMWNTTIEKKTLTDETTPPPSGGGSLISSMLHGRRSYR